MAERWRLKGEVLISCNCDWGCPCNFNARPSKGKCEGGWTWHVKQGTYGETSLDGLNFSVYVNWPGAIHDGNGEALILVDERADANQRRAIDVLLEGKSGGPWEVLGYTWPKVHGPYAVRYDVTFDGLNTRLRCGDLVEVDCAPIKNPVTGVEAHPSIALPEGIIVKRADLGSTSRFRVSKGIAYDHTGQYMAVGPFQYAWP